MFIAINKLGNYQEYPSAQTLEEANLEMQLQFSKEEIEEEEWEVVQE